MCKGLSIDPEFQEQCRSSANATLNCWILFKAEMAFLCTYLGAYSTDLFWNKSIKMLCRIQLGYRMEHAIRRFAFMFGLSGEISVGGICEQGEVGWAHMSKVKFRVCRPGQKVCPNLPCTGTKESCLSAAAHRSLSLFVSFLLRHNNKQITNDRAY